MHITVKTLSDKGLEKNDFRNALEILIDGKSCFAVFDGEPEDATLARDFNDCWSTPGLMQVAFSAGKNGEDFEIEEIEVDEF